MKFCYDYVKLVKVTLGMYKKLDNPINLEYPTQTYVWYTKTYKFW